MELERRSVSNQLQLQEQSLVVATSSGADSAALVPAVARGGRDPLLVRLEQFLKEELVDNDMILDEATGAILYNVNQSAYAIEECQDRGDEKATKYRIAKGAKHLKFDKRKCQRTGNSEFSSQKLICGAVEHGVKK